MKCNDSPKEVKDVSKTSSPQTDIEANAEQAPVSADAAAPSASEEEQKRSDLFTSTNEIAAAVAAMNLDDDIAGQISEIYERMDGNEDYHKSTLTLLASIIKKQRDNNAKSTRRMKSHSSETKPFIQPVLPGMEEHLSKEDIAEIHRQIDELDFPDDVKEYLKTGVIQEDSEIEKKFQEELKKFSDDCAKKQKAKREANQEANKCAQTKKKISFVLGWLGGGGGKKERKPKKSGYSTVLTDAGIPNIIITLNEKMEDRPACPECGSAMRIRTYQDINELIYVPTDYLMITKRIPIYSCSHECVDENDQNVPCVRAEFTDNRLFEKSVATPSLIAGSATDLILGHNPLSNQERILRERGAKICKRTLNEWHMRTAEVYLKPVSDRIIESLLESAVLEMDETPHKIKLKSKKNGKNAFHLKSCYIFAIMTGEMEKNQLAAYIPSVDRSMDVPAEVLKKGFSGTVLADGYQIYDQLLKAGLISKRANDMVHFRREVFDQYVNREDYREFKRLINTPGISKAAIRLFLWEHESLTNVLYIMALVGKLFSVEESCKGKTAEEIAEIRKQCSGPVLDELTKAVEFVMENFEEGSGVWKAGSYFWSRKDSYRQYLEDGNISLDTNRIEGIGIRNFTLLRKDVMMSNSLRGAICTCIFMTIIISARLNGLDPYRYLEYLLSKLMKHRTKGVEREEKISVRSTGCYEGSKKSRKQKDKKIVQRYEAYKPIEFDKEVLDSLLPCSKSLPSYLKAGTSVETVWELDDLTALEVLLQRDYPLSPKKRLTLEEQLAMM